MHNCWVVMLFAVNVPMFATSFDCAKAEKPQEKVICGSPQLSELDDQMAKAYRALLKIAPPEYAAAVREDQRAWLTKRFSRCGPKLDVKSLPGCLKDEYSARIAELHVETKEKGGVLFIWRSITRTTPDSPGELPRVAAEVNPGFGTLQASWPQASKATPEWTAWNAAIEAAARTATLGPGAKSGETKQWTAEAGVDAQTRVAINCVNDYLVCSTISMLWDGHGAHPNHGTSQFNWLLKEKRVLRTEDVFASGSDWQAWIRDQIDTYLHKTLDAGGENDYRKWFPAGDATSTLNQMVSDVSRWRLDEHGISIEFQPYEVACYACTPKPLTVTWSDLKKFLNPAFHIPIEEQNQIHKVSATRE